MKQEVKVSISQESMIWLIGVLQPVSTSELARHLEVSLKSDVFSLSEKVVRKFCMCQMKLNRLIRVGRKPDIFSLTWKGNELLSKAHRHARDMARIYLLKESRKDRMPASREDSVTGSGGDLPSIDLRPHVEGTEAKLVGHYVPRGQQVWPRFSKQLITKTGGSQTSRDTTNHLNLVSFANETQLRVALESKVDQITFDANAIALILGISPMLVSKVQSNSGHYYRSFKLRKKGGGKRKIESPRVFLKVIQQFLNDYILSGLSLHHSVHSYRLNRGIITNASLHSGRMFVGNFDIKNFFGSITLDQVKDHLESVGFDSTSAQTIGGLCCKNDRLPQGACTSPTVSNFILFDFDEKMYEHCKTLNLVYSRYADDITISGDRRDLIVASIEKAEKMLKQRYKFMLNKKKTRISSKYYQQRVTGIVVNENVLPPRKFRRDVRLAFHKASMRERIDEKEALTLRGYYSYLSSFPDLKASKELKRYKRIISKFRIQHRKES